MQLAALADLDRAVIIFAAVFPRDAYATGVLPSRDMTGQLYKIFKIQLNPACTYGGQVRLAFEAPNDELLSVAEWGAPGTNPGFFSSLGLSWAGACLKPEGRFDAGKCSYHTAFPAHVKEHPSDESLYRFLSPHPRRCRWGGGGVSGRWRGVDLNGESVWAGGGIAPGGGAVAGTMCQA